MERHGAEIDHFGDRTLVVPAQKIILNCPLSNHEYFRNVALFGKDLARDDLHGLDGNGLDVQCVLSPWF